MILIVHTENYVSHDLDILIKFSNDIVKHKQEDIVAYFLEALGQKEEGHRFDSRYH
jgi:hypothetical protein